MNFMGKELTLYQWLRAFNWVNYIGLTMILLPIPILYVMVHLWLFSHDPLLYHGSLYAQLAFLMMAWKIDS